MIRRVLSFRKDIKSMKRMLAMIIAFVTGGLVIGVLFSASQVAKARLALN
jgi:hypothetical protein